ncbi:MAG: hypothetical protein FD146_534 [Anaerolineaceae bacterium]|nr:MAG: hypothetical protein FD146_534 [Anaerolineaceae bacterium]
MSEETSKPQYRNEWTKYVATLINQGKTPSQIVASMVQAGWKEDEARKFAGEVFQLVSLTTPAATQPQPPKKKSLLWLYLLLGIIGVCVAVYFIANLSGGGGGGGGGIVQPEDCAIITYVKCQDAYSGVDVVGTVTNACSAELRYVKIVSEVYNAQGILIESDIEWIQNLTYQEQATFESPMRSSSSEVKSCKARVEDADYAP